MIHLCYATLKLPVRFSVFCCINQVVVGKHHLDELSASGRGFVLAVTHVGNLEPLLVSLHTTRHITWLARKEFYFFPFSPLLHGLGALCLKRAAEPPRVNAPARTLRRAISLAHSGQAVGIFPEGGVQRGSSAIFRGGVARGGAALIALHAQVPILPVVVLGTEKLSHYKPWLPYRHGHAAIAYGEPIEPPTVVSRGSRRELMNTLQQSLTETYGHLLEAAKLVDSDVP